MICREKMKIYIYIGKCMCVRVCILPSVYMSPSVVRSGPNLAHTCMQIHLEKVVGKIKICHLSCRGEFGGGV